MWFISFYFRFLLGRNVFERFFMEIFGVLFDVMLLLLSNDWVRKSKSVLWGDFFPLIRILGGNQLGIAFAMSVALFWQSTFFQRLKFLSKTIKNYKILKHIKTT